MASQRLIEGFSNRDTAGKGALGQGQLRSVRGQLTFRKLTTKGSEA